MQITPSILNADLSRLADEVARIPSSDWIHLDVMDGHFVPNLTFGLPVVAALAENFARAGQDVPPFDAHLMIEDPDRWAPDYAEYCKSVTFHFEAAANPAGVARGIRARDARAAMAIKPATSADVVAPVIDELDMVLVMTVEPGFGGQAFMTECLPKVRQIRKMLDGREVWIQVDGGVSLDTIEQCAEAGADVFVAGSAVFRADDPDAMVTALRERAVAACG